MRNVLVSVIITAKNEGLHIGNLIKSIRGQTYKNIEIIVVDNNSKDHTKEIARKYTQLVFNKGPERSAQRNFGASKAKGEYLLFLDADMVLTPTVIEECVKITQSSSFRGVIIPEQSFGEGFWAKVKAFERSFYLSDNFIEAARFYSKKIFEEIGGFDEKITGPEDWDFSQRVRKKYKIERVNSTIRHNEGRLTLWGLMRKKYYYGKKTKNYLSKNKISSFSPQTIFFLRKAFYAKPQKIIAHPILTLAMVLMLVLETIAGAYGFLKGDGE